MMHTNRTSSRAWSIRRHNTCVPKHRQNTKRQAVVTSRFVPLVFVLPRSASKCLERAQLQGALQCITLQAPEALKCIRQELARSYHVGLGLSVMSLLWLRG